MPYYKGHFLFALPSLDGSYFERKVIYLLEHNAHGAMGVVINQSLKSFDVKQLIHQYSLNIHIETLTEQSIFGGGPVDTNVIHVLHENPNPETHHASLELTTSTEMLKSILNGNSWHKHLIIMGRSMWAAGQLEHELEQGVWWATSSFNALVFDVPYQQRWSVGMEQLGINPNKLTAQIGNA